MSPTAAILRAAAAGPTPQPWPYMLASWIRYGSPAWHAAVGLLGLGDVSPVNGLLADLTDCERRAFLILVAEVIDNPQEGSS